MHKKYKFHLNNFGEIYEKSFACIDCKFLEKCDRQNYSIRNCDMVRELSRVFPGMHTCTDGKYLDDVNLRTSTESIHFNRAVRDARRIIESYRQKKK